MQQVHVQAGREIRGQPGQEQIESVVVRRETQGQAPHFTLSQQVDERSSFGGSRAIFRLRSAPGDELALRDRKSTRLNSSHTVISYAVFCLKKKTNTPLAGTADCWSH